jgi:hypothetical protein
VRLPRTGPEAASIDAVAYHRNLLPVVHVGGGRHVLLAVSRNSGDEARLGDLRLEQAGTGLHEDVVRMPCEREGPSHEASQEQRHGRRSVPEVGVNVVDAVRHPPAQPASLGEALEVTEVTVLDGPP